MIPAKESARAHIVFDNDGTMIDSLSNFFDLAEAIIPKHLGRPVTLEEIKAAYIPDWHQLFVNLGEKNPSEELLRKAVIDDLNEVNKDYGAADHSWNQRNDR